MVTPVQQRVYEYIEAHLSEHGYSPSLTEVARGIGISPKSVSLISRSIHALVDAGRLRFDKKGYRKVQVASEATFSLPLMGRIAAGSPIEAIEDRQSIDLGGLLQKADHFALEVRGESMIEEGILNGDLVICRQAKVGREGDIVVALIDNMEATLKRISYQIADRVTLIPANAALKPKAYLPHRVQVQGIYVGLLRLNK
jgi:repressor LexA